MGVGCLSVLLASCSSGRYEPIPETGATLTGTVTLKKEPVRIGMVMVNNGKSEVTGDIGENGRYTVYNAPVGDVTITINMGAARGKLMGEAMAGKSKKPPPKLPDIPLKYIDRNKTPLKTTINKGENTYDIVME